MFMYKTHSGSLRVGLGLNSILAMILALAYAYLKEDRDITSVGGKENRRSLADFTSGQIE